MSFQFAKTITFEQPNSFTFALIKPGFLENLGSIQGLAKERGLEVIDSVRRSLSLQDVRFLYYDLIDNHEIFNPLLNYMRSGPCSMMILRGKDAVNEWRNLMGATDSSKAAEGTIRFKYGNKQVIRMNVVHGSDSARQALNEILYFYKGAFNG